MIRVRELTKNFGAIFAVQGISFEVAKGEIFAFLAMFATLFLGVGSYLFSRIQL